MTDDPKKVALAIEHSIEMTEKDSLDTVGLIEKLDKLASSYREHARDWDGVDDARAADLRRQEEEVHDLRQRLARTVEMETEDIQSMMAESSGLLKEAKNATPPHS